MTTNNTGTGTQFPSLFSDKEAKRLKELEQTKSTIAKVYNQKFTDTAWSKTNPVERNVRDVVSGLGWLKTPLSWTPSNWGLKYGTTPEQVRQTQQDIDTEYYELARKQKVNTILPDVVNNMLAAAMSGNPLLSESQILPGTLGNDFNQADKAYLTNLGQQMAQATMEELLTGSYAMKGSSLPVNYTDFYKQDTSIDPRFIMSTVAFSKNATEISEALKAAYPPATGSGEIKLTEAEILHQKEQVYSTLAARAESLGITGAGVLKTPELIKRINERLGVVHQGTVITLTEPDTGVVTPASLHDDNTVWTQDNSEFLGTYDPKTGQMSTEYADKINELKTQFPDLEDKRVDELVTGALSKPKTPDYESFRQQYYADKGYTNYGDPTSLTYGEQEAFQNPEKKLLGIFHQPVSGEITNANLLSDMAHSTEASEAYVAQYGKWAQKASGQAQALAAPLPTISKLINPSHPEIYWYDPFVDVGTIASLGSFGATGVVGKGLGLLATSAFTVAGSQATWQSGQDLVTNWGTLDTPDKLKSIGVTALNAGLTALAATGVRLTAIQATDEVMGAVFRSNLRSAAKVRGFTISKAAEDAMTAEFLAQNRMGQADILVKMRASKQAGVTVEGSYTVDEFAILDVNTQAKQSTDLIIADMVEANEAMPAYNEMVIHLPEPVQTKLLSEAKVLTSLGVEAKEAEAIAFANVTRTAIGKAQVKVAVQKANKVIPKEPDTLKAKVAQQNKAINRLVRQLDDIQAAITDQRIAETKKGSVYKRDTLSTKMKELHNQYLQV
ncbi:MAG: hypothetical protein WC479_12565, partial [Candidatus Izemoplasmatales bacterium]